jgi:hypothetical protein
MMKAQAATADVFLRVIYVPGPELESVFVITAYELKGKPLSAFKRRMRRRQQ